MCATTLSLQLTPYAAEDAGYMGTYGNTIHRWYRRRGSSWPAEYTFVVHAQRLPRGRCGGCPTMSRRAIRRPAYVGEAADFLWDNTVSGDESVTMAIARCASPAASTTRGRRRAGGPFAREVIHARCPPAELADHYGQLWTADLLDSVVFRAGRRRSSSPSGSR